MHPTALAALAGLASADPAWATELTAASGITGAGTRMEGGSRAWAELGFTTVEGDAAVWSQLGAGLRLSPALELEALLPLSGVIAARQTDIDADSGGGDSTFSALLGNPYLGVNLLPVRGPELRLRIGAGFTLPVSNIDDYPLESDLLPLWAAGGQDAHLWQPGGVSLLARTRVEWERAGLVFSIDVAGIVTLSVADPNAYPPDRTAVLFLQPALEVAGYASADTLIGMRLPLVYDSLYEDWSLSAVPFLRHDIGRCFVEAMVTLNLAGPYGFEASGGPFWGFQLGAGTRF